MVVSTEVRETYREMKPSEFFYEYRELAGFTNATRALYQTVRELVENALDATDVYGIKPTITIIIERVNSELNYYKVTVEDNGVGIDPAYVPDAFGKVLFSSKYKLRQSRGRFGLGAKMAVLYGQMTTGSAVEVYTSPIGSDKIYYFKVKIDVKTNVPIVLARKAWSKRSDWHGTRVSVTVLGDWGKAKHRIYEYLRRTAIVAPYADIVFIDPDGNVTHYPRVIDEVPPGPKEVKPHPHGVDIIKLKEMLKSSSASTIMEFLIKSFQGVGKKTAEKFLEWAKIDPNLDIKRVDDQFIEYLARKLREYKKFRPPTADALSPLGPKVIEAGLKAILKPEFVTVVTRRPRAYSGHPFIVEVGIAYGGGVPVSDEPILLRYANKIPLLYDEKSDVAWKVVDPKNFDWKYYQVSFPAPLAVLTHICSTKIPYRAAGKESVADVPEIEHELKNALREAARRLRAYILKKKKEEEAKRKIITFLKYTPEVAKSLATILKGDGVSEEYIKSLLINAMKKRLNIDEELFNKLVRGLKVNVEE